MGPAGLAMPGDDLSIPENYACVFVCMHACGVLEGQSPKDPVQIGFKSSTLCLIW